LCHNLLPATGGGVVCLLYDYFYTSGATPSSNNLSKKLARFLLFPESLKRIIPFRIPQVCFFFAAAA
jgi:hypothetical protein